ncbi:uncharacterized protein LOC100375620 [Saccoglossus kowalevskii]|uniref:Shugoshin-like 1-like n=1 Tax=Saccoglossus kowalevskii TaxID=10224 RepID=A0ABM0GP63_SACKO|nr:PREDICTED: shugoshin-like 1-like [Saccoglossus kowalevskii]
MESHELNDSILEIKQRMKEKRIQRKRLESGDRSRRWNSSFRSTTLFQNNQALTLALEKTRIGMREAQKANLGLLKERQNMMVRMNSLQQIVDKKEMDMDIDVTAAVKVQMSRIKDVINKITLSVHGTVELIHQALQMCDEIPNTMPRQSLLKELSPDDDSFNMLNETLQQSILCTRNASSTPVVNLLATCNTELSNTASCLSNVLDKVNLENTATTENPNKDHPGRNITAARRVPKKSIKHDLKTDNAVLIATSSKDGNSESNMADLPAADLTIENITLKDEACFISDKSLATEDDLNAAIVEDSDEAVKDTAPHNKRQSRRLSSKKACAMLTHNNQPRSSEDVKKSELKEIRRTIVLNKKIDLIPVNDEQSRRGTFVMKPASKSVLKPTDKRATFFVKPCIVSNDSSSSSSDNDVKEMEEETIVNKNTMKVVDCHASFLDEGIPNEIDENVTSPLNAEFTNSVRKTPAIVIKRKRKTDQRADRGHAAKKTVSQNKTSRIPHVKKVKKLAAEYDEVISQKKNGADVVFDFRELQKTNESKSSNGELQKKLKKSKKKKQNISVSELSFGDHSFHPVIEIVPHKSHTSEDKTIVSKVSRTTDDDKRSLSDVMDGEEDEQMVSAKLEKKKRKYTKKKSNKISKSSGVELTNITMTTEEKQAGEYQVENVLFPKRKNEQPVKKVKKAARVNPPSENDNNEESTCGRKTRSTDHQKLVDENDLDNDDFSPKQPIFAKHKQKKDENVADHKHEMPQLKEKIVVKQEVDDLSEYVSDASKSKKRKSSPVDRMAVKKSRRAAAMVVSYKEPKLHSKLRRGDNYKVGWSDKSTKHGQSSRKALDSVTNIK